MANFNFDQYLSPFTWRYGSTKMRYIFSEKHKIELWRRIWTALAEAQYKAGLVSKEELDDLKKHQNDFNIDEINRIEKETKHDVVAAIREFANKAKIGGGKIHLGATSYDIVDNANMIRIKEALQLIENKLKKLLLLFAQKIEKYASLPCLGYTHLQPAEPTTVGYRLAFYAQSLLIALEYLNFCKKVIKGKGMKGAVGTAASYQALLRRKKINVEELEQLVMSKLEIKPVLISTQTYPQQFDYLVLSALNTLASSLAKFAGDLRILQSPVIGEWSEPFGKKQVGSSAMPFKKNPIQSENICSLARYLSFLPLIALENASLSYLERTLDDSANRRIIIAEGFLAADQILITTTKIIDGLVINEKRIAYNLDQYVPFAAIEKILMEAVKKGGDRQKIHEVLRKISLLSWSEIEKGRRNPLVKLLMKDKRITKFINKKTIGEILDIKKHIGDAPKRAIKLAKKIRKIIKKTEKTLGKINFNRAKT